MKGTRIIHLSNYIQPSGVKIRIRALKVSKGLSGYPFTAERSINGGAPGSWLGCELKTIDWAIKGWVAFEESIGSQLHVE